MLKIFHLSDFHLNSGNLNDWEKYIKKDLIQIIQSNVDSNDNCFIVCTGDLIDKGGAYENNGLTKCFEIFKSKVIDVLLKATNLPLDHFIIIPGNHDIDRRSDEDYEDEGIKSLFYKKGVDYINQFTHNVLTNRNFNGVKRMQPFYEFICDLYKNCQNVHVSYLGMTVVCELKNYTIGFACLNTAWCCYDDNDYKNGVYIGEEQYNDCKNRLDGCTVKIALMHHPIDWIKIERDSIVSWIYKDYDFFLCGHVHKNETNLTYNTYGSLYVDIAPSFTDEVRKIHNFKNGFTMIEYEPMSKKGTTYFYKFKFDERKFILNTDYKEDGKLDFTIYEKTTNDIEYIMTNASEYIKNTQYARFDEMLIPQKANAITSLKEAFVMPRIIKHGDIQNNTVSLRDIINNHANILIFGAYESGKSVLLYRLVEEINDNIAQYCKVPVYIDFNEIGNRDIETEIKSYIDIQSRQVKMLLKNKSIILLVDNYNPKIETRYISKKLYTFLKENEITCIATFSNDLCGIIPQSFSTSPNEIAFEYYHMYPFEAKNVRDMIMKWMPNQDYTHWNNKVSKMVNSFCAYSLPCTPMSVSLYLWSTEKENKKPINQATLMDIC